jgi:phosphoenolpyruvate carboxykinase (ATP)
MTKNGSAFITNQDGEVEYHDEIHETLHRIARVDYTKPIIRNGLDLINQGAPGLLYEEALSSEKGTVLSSTGALITDSGEKKGRSPKDKRIVDEPTTSNDIWVYFI